MVAPAEQMTSAVAQSLTARTGRSLDEGVALLASSGVDPVDHNAVRRWPREAHGVRQDTAAAAADTAAHDQNP
ncbi:MAG: hypothetical protein JWQ45_2403 [Blastococcus sp.]|nr:hypothetical protein [Blastococcus sp.]